MNLYKTEYPDPDVPKLTVGEFSPIIIDWITREGKWRTLEGVFVTKSLSRLSRLRTR